MNVQQPLPPVRKATKRWSWIAGILAFLVVSATATTAKPTTGTTATATAASATAAATATTTANTAATTANTAPKTAPKTAPTTTRQPAPPEVFDGKGDDVVSLKRGAEPGVVTFECPRCTGNVIVGSDGREGLLVNATGAYSGKKLINITDGSTTTSISVRARGSWRLTVSALDTAEMVIGKPATGRGDSVLVLASTFSRATITNRGRGGFAVTYVDLATGRPGLAVDEVGGYRGAVRLPGPSVVQVESSGTWSITPS